MSRRHDPMIAAVFSKSMRGCEKFNEKELLDTLRPTIIKIETDDGYSTDEKLKIFSALTSLSNCAERDRQKYVKKAAKLMK